MPGHSACQSDELMPNRSKVSAEPPFGPGRLYRNLLDTVLAPLVQFVQFPGPLEPGRHSAGDKPPISFKPGVFSKQHVLAGQAKGLPYIKVP